MGKIAETQQSKDLLQELFQVIQKAVKTFISKKKKSVHDKYNFDNIKSLLLNTLIDFLSVVGCC